MRSGSLLWCRGHIAAAYICAALLIAGCQVAGTPTIDDQPSASQVSAEPGEARDDSLAMYRDLSSREVVIAFYADLAGSHDVAEAILWGADKHQISPPLAFALAWAESGYNTRAHNANTSTVDRGLYQLNSASFSWLTVSDFFNPRVSADYGLAHLRFCLDEGGNEIVGLAMYNAGTTGVRVGTPLSTLYHVARILEYRDSVEAAFRDYSAGHGRLAANVTPG